MTTTPDRELLESVIQKVAPPDALPIWVAMSGSNPTTRMILASTSNYQRIMELRPFLIFNESRMGAPSAPDGYRVVVVVKDSDGTPRMRQLSNWLLGMPPRYDMAPGDGYAVAEHVNGDHYDFRTENLREVRPARLKVA